MIKLLYIFSLIGLFGINDHKVYTRNFHQNGVLKAEGWLLNNQKDGYWFFYNEIGTKIEEGHYLKNKKTKWWISYNANSEILKKSEYKNDFLNGYCIIYVAGNPIRGEKFANGVKIKQWNSLAEFKNDNFTAFLD